MDVAFFTRLIASRVTDTVGYLKLVNGAYGDTFPLKLIDTYSFQGGLGNALIHTLWKQGLLLTIDQPSEKKETV